MLIHLTNKCSMGCNHCMNNSIPTGTDHMSKDVLKEAIKFTMMTTDRFIILAGGEPTEHPEFFELMRFFDLCMHHYKNLGAFFSVTIATNGYNMAKDPKTYTKFMDELSNNNPNALYMWQVTSDDRYYPTKINLDRGIFKRKDVTVCTHIESLYLQGRAKENHSEPINSKAPKCFNIRSATRSSNLGIAILQLRMAGKFCTPAIMPDGSIHLGESYLCPSIGATVFDSPEEIDRKCKEFRCDKCGLIKGMPDKYRAAVGEV